MALIKAGQVQVGDTITRDWEDPEQGTLHVVARTQALFDVFLEDVTGEVVRFNVQTDVDRIEY